MRKPSGVLLLPTLVPSLSWVCRPEINFLSLTLPSVDLVIGNYLGFSPIMASLGRFSRFAAVASAALTFSGAYVVFNSRRNPARASGDTSSGYPEEICADRLLFKPSPLRWDPNWDMCDKGGKKSKKKDNGRIEEEPKELEIKATAVRHLVFIRHGQYYLDAANDGDKRLTVLGRYGKNCFACHSFVFLNIKQERRR